MPTLLVVEDEPSLLELLMQLLEEDEHYHVLPARSAERALFIAAAEERPPHLLLLDYLLPGMSGLELYDRLHALPGFQHVPAIMASACLAQDTLRKELNMRGIVAIEKPYDIEALLERVNAAIRSVQSATG